MKKTGGSRLAAREKRGPARLGSRPALLLTGLFLAAIRAQAADLLAKGNEAFRQGKFEEAAKIYESEEEAGADNAERLTRRFNAGVSLASAGKPDEALARFEEVSVRAEGDLRTAAFYNAGHAQFEKGKALAQAALKEEKPEERARKLAEAAKVYHAALDFFRKVEPPGNDTQQNITVTKTALLAALDELNRLEEEKKRKEEDEALKAPSELLRALQARESLHRNLARELAGEAAQTVRLGSRRLRKAEADNRRLAEKLLHQLEAEPAASAPPPQPGQPPNAPEPSDEEKARQAQAAAPLKRAIEAMKDAEVAYANLKAEEAAGAHTRAVVELRSAREAFAVDVSKLVTEAIASQSGVNQAAVGFIGAEEGGSSKNKESGAGLGETLVGALKDKVLEPIAKLLSPARGSRAKALAAEEDDVVWSSGLLSRAEISAPEPQPAQAPQPGPGGQPQPPQPKADPQMIAELNASLKKEGKTALENATRAKEELEAQKIEPALAAGKEALAALERLRALLPKPPEPPEERLKKLIEEQRGEKEAAAGLTALGDDLRAQAEKELEEKQRQDGREAGAVALELEQRKDERAAQAAPKVRQGEAEVYASAEALRRDRVEEGKLAIDRDLTAFEEALALLTGQKDDKEKEQGGEDQQKKEQQPQSRDPKNKKEAEHDRSAYALSAAQARREQEEMDKKRREEEKKIFAGSSKVTVEKDW